MATARPGEDNRMDAAALLLGVLAPPILWSVHLLVSYYLAGGWCASNRSARIAALVALTVVVEAAIVGAMLVARARSGGPATPRPTLSAPAFLHWCAVYSGVLYAIAVVFTAAPMFWLHGC
jgi:hypothetical protein